MATKQAMKENLQCTSKYGQLRMSQDICHVGWQILRASLPYMGIVTICWIIKLVIVRESGLLRYSLDYFRLRLARLNSERALLEDDCKDGWWLLDSSINGLNYQRIDFKAGEYM